MSISRFSFVIKGTTIMTFPFLNADRIAGFKLSSRSLTVSNTGFTLGFLPRVCFCFSSIYSKENFSLDRLSQLRQFITSWQSASCLKRIWQNCALANFKWPSAQNALKNVMVAWESADRISGGRTGLSAFNLDCMMSMFLRVSSLKLLIFALKVSEKLMTLSTFEDFFRAVLTFLVSNTSEGECLDGDFEDWRV